MRIPVLSCCATVLALFGGCFEAANEPLPCLVNADCPVGQACGPDGFCVDGCKGNSDCPDGQVCSAETGQCEDAAAGPDGDADTDSDPGTDSGTGIPETCPDPGTVACDSVTDCAEDTAGCACIDLLGYGGYCYPDCSDCEAPRQCVEDGCFVVGPLEWNFDVPIIDPDVGGGTYIDLDFALGSLDVTFVYAYALRDDEYGYMWIIAYSMEGAGGHLLQIGIDLDAYGEGGLAIYDMNSYIFVVFYEDWYDTEARGEALSVVTNEEILQIDVAGLAVGEHVVGALDAPMMEYRYDIGF